MWNREPERAAWIVLKATRSQRDVTIRDVICESSLGKLQDLRI